jgi:predicted Rdx family selenoprotein
VLRGIELRSGVKGVFKISVDGATVYDKAATGHVPRPEEAAGAVEGRLGPRLHWRKSR